MEKLTEVEVVLSLQTREGDILRVEGVTVAGLEQPEDALLPPGAVHLAGQVVQGVIGAEEEWHAGDWDYLSSKTDLIVWLEQSVEQ